MLLKRMYAKDTIDINLGNFMMINSMYFLAFLSLLFGKNKDPYESNLRLVLNRYCVETVKENKLSVMGSGSGIEVDGTETWGFTFIHRDKVNLSEARRLYVNLIENLIARVNNDPNMQVFLKTKPFSSRNTDIGLVFGQKDNSFICKPYIGYVKLINGIINYSVSETGISRLEDIHEESYEEALRIVREEQRLQNSSAS